MTSTEPEQALSTDVLVIGGGPAGTWAAIKAAQAGADVVLADKGYTGASGATASVGTGIWYVDDVPELREAAMASREALGGFLADRDWMARVLDETHARMDELARIQRYPFPVDAQGRQLRGDLQGPEYMRRQRTRVRRLGARILDHTPALELLTDADGVVSGARALDRTTGETVRIEAGAVVLAAGGCAFQSKTLGCDVNTGDGALLAVEAGARLSGMEFSNAYAIAPKGTSLTKTAYYSWATFYRADGSVLEGAASKGGRSVIARTLLTEPVYARFDKATPDEQLAMRKGQPNTFLVFDRLGIDPFTDPFEITLLAEGTVRGTGGVRIAGQDCSTDVPGLYAAGDTATRELICGGFTGGGSHNAAWAASSGSWAGRGAATFAAGRGRPGRA
ncbi:FAD-binding protein, partial [Streptomyces sp900105245]